MQGLDEVLASLGRIGDQAPEAVRGVFAATASRVVPQAKAMTPDDPETGEAHLRNSVRALKARVTKGRNGGKRVEVTFVAGGAALKPIIKGRAVNVVALVQHEDLTLQHTTGGAKFLERPVLAAAADLPDAIQNAVDRIVESAL